MLLKGSAHTYFLLKITPLITWRFQAQICSNKNHWICINLLLQQLDGASQLSICKSLPQLHLRHWHVMRNVVCGLLDPSYRGGQSIRILDVCALVNLG